MATILQIETATQVCSAAIAHDGKTIALKEMMANNIHAGSLTLFIKEAMDSTGFQFEDLDAIAVSMGPGSYTGLRIGVSTAKGLCYALDKPLIAVPTLQMMAEGFMRQNPEYADSICSMIDARRMEVFTSLYDSDLKMLSPVSAKIISEYSFSKELDNGIVTFIGNGAAKCAPVLQHENARFSELNFNSASYMSKLAHTAYSSSRFEDVAYFEPFYLKDFVLTTPKKK
ncbi:tRNA (adenosine(37)-N6)-threonylcarbamoyltransferase complex dimerization subunit type 1 TsaB [Pedobacter ginsengisoli]|uniref:tRNA (Adenosine(37)-N6)-threonylcarbamoyltransferase complex dimerization subunit type 1 TsaB n=1 Tax=Pedobacter ginsengisoli TaxID=363852 RepID=A0A2D1U1I3_9SPHI|nr:tRNA (adenosine(37)-N6)-threonylcarbamoyltransferase complex dimerization subunit type 1 TsaB [Pedobacter ginsengisoli]ATP55449.1 tRNA (adenosine(37)-N6)-threonylcarbamoyltransferase complex dimerization subunit type 1 TsaB [Pedobacter ginsengisoli]